MSKEADVLKIGITELNQHFVCVLCFGYFVDATTINECLHTFCKSCIVNFLSTNHHCPHCDTLLSRTRPLNSLRLDHAKQTLVYKMVPGLFQTEMRRRIQFYQSRSKSELKQLEAQEDMEDVRNYIFSADDSISLAIKYYDKNNVFGNKDSNSEANISRYFRCPATVPIRVLKALIKIKHRIPDSLRVEILYNDERLLDSWTLMEVAYIYKWQRESPMELYFQILATRKVKKMKKVVVKRKFEEKDSSQNTNLKKSKTDKNSSYSDRKETDDSFKKLPRIETSTTYVSEESHPRPPTPPETPEEMVSYDCNDFSPDKKIKYKAKTVTSGIKTKTKSKEGSKVKDENIPKSLERPTKKLKIENDSETRGNTVPSNSLSKVPIDCLHDSKNNSLCEDAEKTTYDDNSELINNKETNKKGAIDNTDDKNLKDTINNIVNSLETRCDEANASDSSDKNDESDDSAGPKDEENIAEETEENDVGVVLDLSCPDRKIKTNDINNSGSSPISKDLKENSASDIHENGSASKSRNDLFYQAQQISALNAPNAKLPVDWQLPQIPNVAGIAPHAAAFRDLVTLSQAAAHLQFAAIAHAQAQAQAHAQKRKDDAKRKEDALKNLKGTETLSFVNGSGDTLTISPITTKKSITAPKIPIPKGIRVNKVTVGKPGVQSKVHPGSKLSHTSKGQKSPNNCRPVKTPLNGLSGHVNEKKFIQTKYDEIKHKKPLLKDGMQERKISKNVANNRDQNLSKMEINAKESSLKLSQLSLKVPLVNNISKTSDEEIEEKTDNSKDINRTGDDVFKITNQKLLECLRQQHQFNKQKQNSHQKPSSTLSKSPSHESAILTTHAKLKSNMPPTKLNNNLAQKTTLSSQLTKPVNTVSSKSVNTVSSKPINTVSSKPINTVASKPINTVSSKPINPVSSKPINTVSSKPVTTISNKNCPLQAKSQGVLGISHDKKENEVKKSDEVKSNANGLTTTKNGSASLTVSKTSVSTTSSTSTNKCNTSTISTCDNSSNVNLSDKPNLSTSQPKSNIGSISDKKQESTKSPTSSLPLTKTLTIPLTQTSIPNSFRTTNSGIRQIPNPSRLHQQSESRISGGINRGFHSSKRPYAGSGDRLESVTRTLHEKVAASAAGIMNSLAS